MLQAKVNDLSTHQIEFDRGSDSQGNIDGTPFTLDKMMSKPGSYSVIHNEKSYTVEVISADASEKAYVLLINGRKYEVALKDRYDALLKSLGMDNLLNAQVKEIKAPMPGLVLDILVEPGTSVAKGDPVLILEAMKMENVLKSPTDGVVKSIPVEQGNAVEKNQVLVHFE